MWTTSFVDLRLLGRAEELRRCDSQLVRRAHAIPSELLPARTNAAQPAGQTATAARRREPGGRRGAGERGEDMQKVSPPNYEFKVSTFQIKAVMCSDEEKTEK